MVAQRKRIRLGTTRLRVQSLASLSGSGIWHCRELWRRLQTWLGFGLAVAVVQAGSNSSDLTPSLGTSICHRSSPKKTKNKLIKEYMEGSFLCDSAEMNLASTDEDASSIPGLGEGVKDLAFP